MANTEINKTENEYISKHLAPLIEKGIITDVKEGGHSKIFFDLSKKINRLTVSCQLESSGSVDIIVFKLWDKSKSGEEDAPWFYDIVRLPRPDAYYHKVVEMEIKEVVREFKKALTELQTEQLVEEEKAFSKKKSD